MLKTLAQKIDPKHAAILVVEEQNDFCHDAGFIGKTGRDMSFKKKMAHLLDKARRHHTSEELIKTREKGH
jgi:nicotinamidase-related amidase